MTSFVHCLRDSADYKIQLEVVAGPVSGLRAEKQVVGSNAVLTIGRMPQNDLVLNDPEVSGKHVVISWNGKVRYNNYFMVFRGSVPYLT